MLSPLGEPLEERETARLLSEAAPLLTSLLPWAGSWAVLLECPENDEAAAGRSVAAAGRSVAAAAGRTVTDAGRSVAAAGRSVAAAGRNLAAAGRSVAAAGRSVSAAVGQH